MHRVVRSPLLFALVALGLLLIAAERSRPCFFLHDDNATWFVAAYAHDFRVLTETGRIAEVNYFQYGGEPFLEQGQTAVLYPPVYVAEFLAHIVNHDDRWGVEWIAALHLLLGLAGFYFWLRQGGVPCELAALGGLAWALNPFVVIAGASWIMVTFVAAWLPWVFWALDRLFARPSFGSSVGLGTIFGLFFLQGYVQWVVYTVIFAALYAFFLLGVRKAAPRAGIIHHLVLAALIGLAWSAPLLLPMLHALGASAARAQALSLDQILFYRVQPDDLLRAQWGNFRTDFMFGMSSALFFCPALVLLPLTLVGFWRGGTEMRQRLFSLIVLALLALLFSTRGHVLLNLLPVMQKFRWPFKVFVFADFFLIAALAWSMASLLQRRPFWAGAVLSLVVFAQADVALTQHDTNFISKTTLPTSHNPLPTGMDPRVGRVVAIDNILPETDGWRFYTHCYGTYFEVPSLGGYNPLVGRDQLDYAQGLDFPNVLYPALTPELRQQLEARAVRYWLVDPHSPRRAEVEALDGLKLLVAEPDRLVYEDTRALPLAFSAAAPSTSLPLDYSGNSLLIQLDQAGSPVEVSVGPTDGWWYRINGGPWEQTLYLDSRLDIPVDRFDRDVEISYFDPRFREGLFLSAVLMVLIGLPRLLRRKVAASK